MAKNYTKNTWVDEVLAGAERYDVKDDPGTTTLHGNVQIGLHTGVVTPGSALTAAWMNNLEVGVDGLDTASTTGWIPANEAWSYASATTITVPSGATARYAVGDRIKLTQTTVKYFYVVAVASTLLTVTGGSDYAVANAAISANYYSHAASPVGFPQWFNYAVTPSWTASVAPSGSPTNQAIFCIIGNACTAQLLFYGYTAGTGVTAVSFNLPVVAFPSAQSAYGDITVTNAPNLSRANTNGGNAFINCASVAANRFAFMGTYKF